MRANIQFTTDHYAPNCTGGAFGMPGILSRVGGACSGAWSDPASTVTWAVCGRDDDGVDISVDTRYLACKRPLASDIPSTWRCSVVLLFLHRVRSLYVYIR